MAMDLQSPSVLAQLPRPLHASKGKTHIGEVYSLADAKKRKRYEVAVAVDGEAVNIYNIQTPKLATSYAVPPQSTFSCQPCSVRRKLPSKSAVKRQTYAAVNPQQEIRSFVEESSGAGPSAPVITSSSYSVKDSKSPAVFVGIVPTAAKEEAEETEDPFDVLAVHQDGHVRRLSPDLSTQRWSLQHSAIAKQLSSHTVDTCFLVEFEDAKKSLFKKRQDLAALAVGDLTGSGVDEPAVLMLVSHPTGSEQIQLSDVQVHVFSVPVHVPSQGRSLDESQKLRHLLTVNMPEVEGLATVSNKGLEWDFHSGSAGLNLSFEKGFVNFDMSQYTPTVTSKFILEEEDFSSIMRISPQSVIGAGKSMIAVYDTQYKSIQQSLIDIPAGDNTARTKFINYYAKLGIAVATKGNTLLAFDLSSSNASSSGQKRPRDGLLIDAIGRGIGSSHSSWQPSKKQETGTLSVFGFSTDKEVEQWTKFTHDLQEATKTKNADQFDRTVKTYFCNGNESASLPTPTPKHYISPEKLFYLLSLIFSVKDTDNNKDKDQLSASSSLGLSINLWPTQTCDWLINLGLLSQDSVEMTLRRTLKPRILPSLPTGSFAAVLIDSDPSLHRLTRVLQGPVFFHPDELAYTLKLVLNMARNRPLSDEEQQSTLPTTTTSPQNQPQTQTQTQQTNSHPTVPAIFQTLNTILLKLNRHPPATTTSSVRSALSRPDLLAMVHHLRISLATGGHTTRFTENPPTPITPSQITPSLPLDTITAMLNIAVDAIGPSGWVSASPTAWGADDSAAAAEIDLIADLKCEISAALAGVEEANYLRGILEEYLSYAEDVERNMKRGAPTSSSALASADKDGKDSSKESKEKNADEAPLPSHVRHQRLNGADLFVFGAGDEEGLGAYAGSGEGGEGGGGGGGGEKTQVLPLSLKAEATDVSRKKVKKSTGEIKNRSMRERGYLRRKAMGKYSFERLVV